MYWPRALESRLFGRASRNKVRLLFGARQTGKTSILRQALPSEQTHVFDLQEARLRQRLEADPSALSREIVALPRQVQNTVIDAVQHVPALLDEAQALHGPAPRRRPSFPTSSSARRLRAAAA